MAEEKKSIEISYKANLQDLLAKLKTIPNVTDAEAKKMVAALDRQLKQAENAAKKSAEASKQAAQAAGKAAQRSAADFENLADSARNAESKLERVGESAGDIDRGFSSIGLALRGVNPQLAETADSMADAMAVTEGLSMSFKALNPVVLASAAVVGGLILAYQAYQQDIEKARQLTLDMKEAQRSLNDQLKEQKANFGDSLDKLGEIQDEYAVLTGQIDEYELAMRKTKRSTEAMFQSNIDNQQAVIDGRKEDLALINSMMDANYKSIEQAALLSENEKDRLKNLQLLTAGVDKSIDLTAHDYTLNNELAKIKAALTNEIAKQEQGMQILVGHQKQAVDLSMQMQEFENASAQAKDRQSTKQKEIVQDTEKENDELRKLIEADMERFKKLQDASYELQTIKEEAGLSEAEMKELQFERELEHIRQLGEETALQAEATMAIDAMVAARKLEDEKKIQEEKKKTFDQDMQNAGDLVGAFGNFSDAVLQAAMDNGRANQKVINSLFRMNQAAAVGEIAFSTAKAVTEALAYPPVLRGAMIATAIGTGAAQTAIVMAQQPPQATFHMGGMAPDEMPARVLKGEAVLDRATVDRLGGEPGIQKLQQGNNTDKVVVIQPFKHFGRFAREIGFKAPKQTGLKAY